MRHPIPAGIFKPTLTTGEKKSEATTRAAREIIDQENSKRDAKTARLRLARLERELEQQAVEPVAKRRAKT